MTRPRKRPVGGRYWLEIAPDGETGVYTDRETARGLSSLGFTIVECVAMPRVTIVRLARGRHSVRVNDVEVMATAIEPRAKKAARDLRRALRGK